MGNSFKASLKLSKQLSFQHSMGFRAHHVHGRIATYVFTCLVQVVPALEPLLEKRRDRLLYEPMRV